jgi:hypothetical protein
MRLKRQFPLAWIVACFIWLSACADGIPEDNGSEVP